MTEAAVTTQAFTQERTPAMLIGELAHRFLENWDFGSDKNLQRHQLGAFLSASLSAEYSQDAGSIGEELQAILERFINSPIYAELRQGSDPRPRSAAIDALEGPDHGRGHRSYL